MKPLAIDLFCGLGGWTEGLIAEGFEVVGFDITQHVYGDMRYPARLVLQDVLTIHGRQFMSADLIVGSSPCQEFSYRAMPWKKAKALGPPVLGMKLFHSQFRIQREACEAAGRHIPMVVENVRGAIPWVGRSRWNYGSFHLWGDVPALMPMSLKVAKVPGFRFDGSGKSFQSASVAETGNKGVPHRPTGHWTNPAENGGSHKVTDEGTKIGGDWFSDPNSTCRKHGSKSLGRKMASAMIAKIPLPLSRHIARTYYPDRRVA